VTKIVALVPMRHHSERVAGKNYRAMAGRPLYAYILGTLLSCSEIAQVIVDTDSPIIMQGINSDFPAVQVWERPDHLRAGGVPMNEILLHDVGRIEADFYLQTHSTNPLLRPETVALSIRTFLEKYPTYDSLFSVTRLQTRLWDSLGRAMNHNPAVLLRTQDLPPVYEENSCLYIFTRQTLVDRYNRLGERPLMFPIDRAEAWDIDEEIDFQIAEHLLKHNLINPKPQPQEENPAD
jgi:CMP-N-acetylneuraminic acid synthetase